MAESDWRNVQRNKNTGQYRTKDASGGSSTLAGLDDVDLSSLSDGQILRYDSQNEKWVNDDESDGSSGHNYSTTEQVVATWIDGKPIYEKTFQFSNYVSLPTKTWATVMDVSSLSISKLVRCDFIDMEGVYWSGALNRISNGNLQSYVFEGWPVKELTLQYTKTTD